MNRKLLFLLALLVLPLLVSSVVAESIHVYGQVMSVPAEIWYDVTKYYSFNFTVHVSNASSQSGDWFPGKVLAVLLNVSLVQKPPEKDVYYNFTGNLNNNPDDVIPDNSFVVESVMVKPGPGWMDQITVLINLLSGLTAGIVNVIVSLIQTFTGYQVPTFIVTAILATTFVIMLKKYWKVLGLLFAFILLFLAVSGGAYMIKLLFWH